MGCNICISNRENYIENEFLYEVDNLNIKNDNQNNENNKDEMFKSSHIKKIKNNLNDKNTDKDKDKDFLTNQITPIVKIEPKNDNIFKYSLIKQNEGENDSEIPENKNNEKNEVDDIMIKENKIIEKENITNDQKLNEVENNTENNEKNNLNINIFKSNNKIDNAMENQKEIGNSKNNISINSFISSSNKNDYNTRIIELINQLRANPAKYSDYILSNLQYINKRVKIIADDITGQNEEKIEFFFQKKVKVELYRGEVAFIETAKYLYNLKPLNELKIKDEIKINILPETEEQLKDDKLLIKKQVYEIQKKFNISAFFKDTVKNPEIGLMLMIIGDYKNSKNKKRNAILNPDYKYIGINSKFIGEKFVSYFTFSK